MPLADRGDQLQAVDAGHLQVGQNQSRRRPADLLQRLLAVVGVLDGKARVALENFAGQRAIDGAIVHNQHAGHATGSVSNRRLLRIRTVPACRVRLASS